jgi:hypothetical protein
VAVWPVHRPLNRRLGGPASGGGPLRSFFSAVILRTQFLRDSSYSRTNLDTRHFCVDYRDQIFYFWGLWSRSSKSAAKPAVMPSAQLDVPRPRSSRVLQPLNFSFDYREPIFD